MIVEKEFKIRQKKGRHVRSSRVKKFAMTHKVLSVVLAVTLVFGTGAHLSYAAEVLPEGTGYATITYNDDVNLNAVKSNVAQSYKWKIYVPSLDQGDNFAYLDETSSKLNVNASLIANALNENNTAVIVSEAYNGEKELCASREYHVKLDTSDLDKPANQPVDYSSFQQPVTSALEMGTPINKENTEEQLLTNPATNYNINVTYKSSVGDVVLPYSNSKDFVADTPFSWDIDLVDQLSTIQSVSINPKDDSLTSTLHYDRKGFKLSSTSGIQQTFNVVVFIELSSANYTISPYYQTEPNGEDYDKGDDVVHSQRLGWEIPTPTDIVELAGNGYTPSFYNSDVCKPNAENKVQIRYDRDYVACSFNANGGVNTQDPVYGIYGSKFPFDSTAGKPSAPQREGYTFAGWFYTEDGKEHQETEWKSIPNVNRIYYAHWTTSSGDARVILAYMCEEANSSDYEYKIERYDLVGVDSIYTLPVNGSSSNPWDDRRFPQVRAKENDEITPSKVIEEIDTARGKKYNELYEYAGYQQGVKVDASGNTVVNVYLKRKRFTYTFVSGSGSTSTSYSIKARWDQNIYDTPVVDPDDSDITYFGFKDICHRAYGDKYDYGHWIAESISTSGKHWVNLLTNMGYANETYTRDSIQTNGEYRYYLQKVGYPADYDWDDQSSEGNEFFMKPVPSDQSENFNFIHAFVGNGLVAAEDYINFVGYRTPVPYSSREKLPGGPQYKTSTSDGVSFYYLLNKYSVYLYNVGGETVEVPERGPIPGGVEAHYDNCIPVALADDDSVGGVEFGTPMKDFAFKMNGYVWPSKSGYIEIPDGSGIIKDEKLIDFTVDKLKKMSPSKIDQNLIAETHDDGTIKWYQDPGCTKEFDIRTETMPNHELNLYVHWIAPKQYVHFWTQDPNTEVEDGSFAATEEVYNTFIDADNVPKIKEYQGWRFSAWWYWKTKEDFDSKDPSRRTYFKPDLVPIPANTGWTEETLDGKPVIRFHQEWVQNDFVQYTTKHILKTDDGDEIEVAAPRNNVGKAAEEVTVNALTNPNDFYDNFAYVVTISGDPTQTGTLDRHNPNIFTFEYVRTGTLKYTVRCVDTNGSTIIPDKVIENVDKRSVDVDAPDLTDYGYHLSEGEDNIKSITLVPDPKENENIAVFEYSENDPVDFYYNVKTLKADESGPSDKVGGVANPSSQEGLSIRSKEAQSIAIPYYGFEFLRWEKVSGLDFDTDGNIIKPKYSDHDVYTDGGTYTAVFKEVGEVSIKYALANAGSGEIDSTSETLSSPWDTPDGTTFKINNGYGFASISFKSDDELVQETVVIHEPDDHEATPWVPPMLKDDYGKEAYISGTYIFTFTAGMSHIIYHVDDTDNHGDVAIHNLEGNGNIIDESFNAVDGSPKGCDAIPYSFNRVAYWASYDGEKQTKIEGTEGLTWFTPDKPAEGWKITTYEFYVHFEEDFYTVNFDNDGHGSFNPIPTADMKYHGNSDFVLYNSGSLSLKEVDGGEEYSIEPVPDSGYILDKWTYKFDGGSETTLTPENTITINKNVVLKAYFKTFTTTLHFETDANGSLDVPADETISNVYTLSTYKNEATSSVDKGDMKLSFVNEAGSPTTTYDVKVTGKNPGIVFTGWKYRHNLVDSWMPLPSEGDKVSGETYFLATFAPKTDDYTLTFDAENGRIQPDVDKSVAWSTGGKYSFTTPDPTEWLPWNDPTTLNITKYNDLATKQISAYADEGYYFDAWYVTDDSGEHKITEGNYITPSIKGFKAKFVKNNVEVKFSDGDGHSLPILSYWKDAEWVPTELSSFKCNTVDTVYEYAFDPETDFYNLEFSDPNGSIVLGGGIGTVEKVAVTTLYDPWTYKFDKWELNDQILTDSGKILLPSSFTVFTTLQDDITINYGICSDDIHGYLEKGVEGSGDTGLTIEDKFKRDQSPAGVRVHPNDGYKFIGWSIDNEKGEIHYDDVYKTPFIPPKNAEGHYEDHHYYAHFALDLVSVTLKTDGNGTINSAPIVTFDVPKTTKYSMKLSEADPKECSMTFSFGEIPYGTYVASGNPGYTYKDGTIDPTPTTLGVIDVPTIFTVNFKSWLVDNGIIFTTNGHGKVNDEVSITKSIETTTQYNVGISEDKLSGFFKYGSPNVTTINAVPEDGYKFDHWEATGALEQNPVVDGIIIGITTYKAIFTHYDTNVKFSTDGYGKVKLNGGTAISDITQSITTGVEYSIDSGVFSSKNSSGNGFTITPEPDSGYIFDSWKVNSYAVDSKGYINGPTEYVACFKTYDADITFMTDGNATLSDGVSTDDPMYKKIETTTEYSITTEADLSASSFSYADADGKVINIKATAKPGYHFNKWIDTRDTEKALSSGEILENCTYKALFVPYEADIYFEAGLNGSVSEASKHVITQTDYEVGFVDEVKGTFSSQSYNMGVLTKFSIIAEPNPGYHFVGWTIGSEGSAYIENGKITGSVKYVANFVENGAITINYKTQNQSYGKICLNDGSESWTSETSESDSPATGEFYGAVAHPMNGYEFEEWVNEGNVSVSTVPTLEIKKEEGAYVAHTYTAKFKLITDPDKFADIKYQVVSLDNDGEVFSVPGGTLSNYEEKINAGKGTAEGSNAKTNSGFTFLGWYSTAESTTPITSTLDFKPAKTSDPQWGDYYESTTYFAKFKENPDVTINYVARAVDKDGYVREDVPEGLVYGTVSSPQQVLPPASGVASQVVATASNGWSLKDWTYIVSPYEEKWVCGDSAFTPNKEQIGDMGETAYVGRTYYANFVEDSDVDINYKVNENDRSESFGGYITKIGVEVETWVENTSQSLAPSTGVADTVTAKAKNGYHFVNWTDKSGKPVGTPGVPSFTPEKIDGVYTANEYTANFAEDVIDINFVPGKGGTIKKTTEEPVSTTITQTLNAVSGTCVPILAVANDGYTYKEWTNQSGAQVSGENYPMYAPQKTGDDFWGYSYKADTYTANFIEAGAITINYNVEDSHHGKIRLNKEPVSWGYQAQESDGPITGVFVGAVAHPMNGYKFVNWTKEDGSLAGEQETLVITREGEAYKAHTYTAHFIEIPDPDPGSEAVIDYVAMSYDNQGAVTTKFEGGKLSNSNDTIKPASGIPEGSIATANNAFTFIGWFDQEVGGTAIATTPNFVPEKFKDPEWGDYYKDATYYARFKENPDVTINYVARAVDNSGQERTVSVPFGSVTPTLSILAPVTAQQIPLSEAKAENGWSLKNWTNGDTGDEVSTSDIFIPVKETVSGLSGEAYVGRTYYANFVEDPDITITFKAGDGGHITKIDDTYTWVDETSQTLAPSTGIAKRDYTKPKNGYHFVNWTDENGNPVGVPGEPGLTPQKVNGVYESHTYTANFAENDNIDIVFVANNGGYFDVGGQKVKKITRNVAPATGTCEAVEAIPQRIYHYFNWTDSHGSEVSPSTQPVFAPEKEGDDFWGKAYKAETYYANFEINPTAEYKIYHNVETLESCQLRIDGVTTEPTSWDKYVVDTKSAPAGTEIITTDFIKELSGFTYDSCQPEKFVVTVDGLAFGNIKYTRDIRNIDFNPIVPKGFVPPEIDSIKLPANNNPYTKTFEEQEYIYPDPAQIVIPTGVGDLTIDVPYKEKLYEVNYYVNDEELGSVVPDYETCLIINGSPEGSLATAKEGGEFVNWTDEDGNVVSEDPNYIPPKYEPENKANANKDDGEIIYASVEYTANFQKAAQPEPKPVPPSDNGAQTGDNPFGIFGIFSLFVMALGFVFARSRKSVFSTNNNGRINRK